MATGLNSFILVPAQVIIIIIFLFDVLGFSTFAGTGVGIIFAPIMFMIILLVSLLTVTHKKTSDSRMTAVSEMMHDHRVVKLYGWEPSFLKRIKVCVSHERTSRKYSRRFATLHYI